MRLFAGAAVAVLATGAAPAQPSDAARTGPIWVYNNWSAYDELSDSVPLTETLAMRELDELLRLRRAGVHFDYYVMDAFWYAPDGGYRTWRADTWPEGPDRWLARLKAQGILPGLWFSTNTLTHMQPAPQWRSSLDASGTMLALYTGGFLADFMDVLQSWYDRGVRLFKFDFAEFGVIAAADQNRITPEDARSRNIAAFRKALAAFRARNPDAVLVAFNGFGGDFASTGARFPFEEPVDAQWLAVFDALFSGDPRPSDVPEMNFWRSVDLYSDHMVRRFEQSGIPLARIDSTGFMIGSTGTIYDRRTAAWQGMLLSLMARGGRVNTVHGNLEFLDDAEARWFAKAQALYEPLQRAGAMGSFGGIPGDAEPYGFAARGPDGALDLVVNPTQSVRSLNLPAEPGAAAIPAERILFRDAGFEPALDGDSIRLGPGQLALVGIGRYADAANDLGIGADVRIPRRIAPWTAALTERARPATVTSEVMPPETGDLRIVVQQHDSSGRPLRSVSESGMGGFFVITAVQDGALLPLRVEYNKLLWSGLSWAVAEIQHDRIAPGKPISLRVTSAETDPIRLDVRLYRVEY